MIRRSIFFTMTLLMALSLTALSQTKPKARASRNPSKPVTVTLVRWPYT